MKNMVKFLGIIAIAAIIGFTFAACDNGTNGGGGTPTVNSVVVNPQNASVERGGTYDFTAIVTGTNNPPQSVTWTIQGFVQPGTGISAEGRLTIGSGELTTTFYVRATSTFDTWRSARATVTVIDTVTSVQVTPPVATVPRGGTHNFTATVLGNNPPQDVTWSVVRVGGWPAVDPVAGTWISADGQLTVAADQTIGTITVVATSTLENWRRGYATVTITN